MTSPSKPLADRVLAVRDVAATQTASGIYLPDTAKEKSTLATVIAIGAGVSEVKVDDKIVYKEYGATELKIDGTDYLIINEEDILATA